MAGGDTMGCAARRKSKKNSDYSLSSENGEGSKNVPPIRTTRGGLRVYKIVILGDGGVGKSGEWFFNWMEFVCFVFLIDR